MKYQEKNKECQEDHFELLTEFKNYFITNSQIYSRKSEKDLKKSQNQQEYNRNNHFLKNEISQNRITRIQNHDLKINYQSKQKYRSQTIQGRYSTLQSRFKNQQEKEFRLPEIKSFNKRNQQNKQFVYKNIKLPGVDHFEYYKKPIQKTYSNFLTQRIEKNTNYQKSQIIETSRKKLISMGQSQDHQTQINRIRKNESRLLQYLEKKNNNKQSKQNIISTIINKKLQQKNNPTYIQLNKQYKIQDLRKKTQQKNKQQRKVKQSKFFQDAKKKDPIFNQIIKKCEQKHESVFKDQNILFKKKIFVEKSQFNHSKIKVGVQVKQQGKNSTLEEKYLFKSQIKNLKKTWQLLQTMQDENSELSRIISYEQMNVPVDQSQINQSKILREGLEKKIQEQLDEFGILLKKVAQQMEKHGKPVIITEKSTVKSQISLRTLIGGFMNDIVKVEETISDYDPNCPFSYSQLQDTEEFQKFCAWYKIKTATETGLDPNGIVIHCVSKGSIKVEWSTNQSYVLDAAFVQKPELKKRLKLHSFFESFQLSPEDFDPQGNIQFDQQRFDILQRGGWPYYQPVKCKRYGINVSGKYDNGNDRWLSMNGKPGEWAVAFHGVSTPKRRISGGDMTILQSIMSGIDSNIMLRVGQNNYYENDVPVNYPSGKVIGKGIYCTPHIQQTFPYTCNPSEKYNQAQRQYGLIFQCRVNPKEIKVTRKNAYWVISHSKDIRPYGIILVKRDVFKDYPTVQQQFGQPFKYNRFKDYIEDFQKQVFVKETK